MIDFSSEKYIGSTGHRYSWYQQRRCSKSSPPIGKVYCSLEIAHSKDKRLKNMLLLTERLECQNKYFLLWTTEILVNKRLKNMLLLTESLECLCTDCLSTNRIAECFPYFNQCIILHTYSMNTHPINTYVLLHFEHKNNVTIIVKLFYGE